VYDKHGIAFALFRQCNILEASLAVDNGVTYSSARWLPNKPWEYDGSSDSGLVLRFPCTLQCTTLTLRDWALDADSFGEASVKLPRLRKLHIVFYDPNPPFEATTLGKEMVRLKNASAAETKFLAAAIKSEEALEKRSRDFDKDWTARCEAWRKGKKNRIKFVNNFAEIKLPEEALEQKYREVDELPLPSYLSDEAQVRDKESCEKQVAAGKKFVTAKRAAMEEALAAEGARLTEAELEPGSESAKRVKAKHCKAKKAEFLQGVHDALQLLPAHEALWKTQGKELVITVTLP